MEFIEAIKEAGVTGAGGAGFPTHVKLNAQAEYFLVNAAECEPLIETDKYLCRTYPERIVKTIAVIAEHLGAAHAVIAIKGKYTAEICALENAIADSGADVEIFRLRTFYPAGDEQVIVQQVTGRCVPERGIPLDVGCVVDNVGTVLSIADALDGIPVTDKFLSVTGVVLHPSMFCVPLGTAVTEILEKAEVLVSDYGVILGGPMMGKVLSERSQIEEAVVTKTTGNLLVLPKDHYLMKRAEVPERLMARQAAAACIQCRMCTDMCPRHLIGHDVRPNMVMRNIWREKQIETDEEYESCFGSAANCCSCGVCEMFACPMGLSPRKINEYVKKQLKAHKIDPPRNLAPAAHEAVEERKIPTERLIARLGLWEYDTHETPVFRELDVTECSIPLSQHIGRPCTPVVSTGDWVEKGSVIASAEGLAAQIHASLTGTVVEVTDREIRICKEED